MGVECSARYLPGLLLTILLGSRQSQTRTMVLVGQCRAEGVVRISCREGQWSEIGASQARHDLLGLCKLHVMSTARTDGFMAERHEQHKGTDPRNSLCAEMAKKTPLVATLCGASAI